MAAAFSRLQDQLSAGDQAGARASLQESQRLAHDAHGHTDGPAWWSLSHAPEVGDDVVAVRTVAQVSDTLSTDVLPDVVSTSEKVTPAKLRPVAGTIDLEPLRSAQPALARIDTRLGAQSSRVGQLQTTDLMSGVAGPVKTLKQRLLMASSAADRADRAARLLPTMLGGDRRYLLVFQNNAEVRSSGGIAGSYALLTARDGKIGISEQGSSASLGDFTSDPVPVTDDEKGLFGTSPGRFPQDVTSIPDFPRTAQLISAMWQRDHPGKLDGVVSTDPVALAELLRGTGPIAVPGGRLTADDAVAELLSRTYARFPDPDRQDAYFAAVARQVFQAVVTGQGQPRAVLSSLATTAGQGRFLVWSSHSDEQDILEPTRVAGLLNPGKSVHPQIGIFLNDNGASKLDYYLHYDVDVQPRNCVKGEQRMVVTLKLRSEVPKDTSSLPDYVTNNAPGKPRGRITLTALAYAPTDGSVAREELDGKAVDASLFTHDGRRVALRPISLDPGQTRRVRWFMTSGPGQTGSPTLRVTPGVHSDGVGTVGPGVC